MHNVTSPRTDDSAIEQEIQAKGLTAPRVTPADIEAAIASEHYFTAEDGACGAEDFEPGPERNPSLRLLTFCVLTLHNGFTVTGESACASPENFDAELGRKIARQNATNKMWLLLGFALKERLASDEPGVKMERIARVCHEVNRAYCQALGDNSQPAWEAAPQWQRESARAGVDLHLSGDFGPEASHISWMQQKLADGWTYGPEKNPDLKQHPCMVPFDQLPREQQAKDFIFRAVVHALR